MALTKNILVVEDEKDLPELIALNLTKAGYGVSIAQHGRRALERIGAELPDLVILDVMLPEFSGTEIAARLRANPRTSRTPIIMLTAKGSEADQLTGLAAGADDYITKPFSMRLLLARVGAVLRRTAGGPAEELRLGPVEVDLGAHDARVDGRPLRLTLTEFKLLAALMEGAGRVLSRSALVSRAIGPGVAVTERTIDVHVTALRKKLGSGASIIKTVRGVGYRATLEAGEGVEEE